MKLPWAKIGTVAVIVIIFLFIYINAVNLQQELNMKKQACKDQSMVYQSGTLFTEEKCVPITEKPWLNKQ
jgi:membrane protein YdbS with pleckstrin-like domain